MILPPPLPIILTVGGVEFKGNPMALAGRGVGMEYAAALFRLPFLPLLSAAMTVFPAAGRGADPAAIQDWATSVVAIESATGKPRAAGCGVMVSGRGHVVTTWSTVYDAEKLKVRATNGTVSEVVGVVAADRGRELVLLATKPTDRGAPPAILLDRAVAVGEPVHAIGAPGAGPLAIASDRIDSIESGERYRRTCAIGTAPPIDADQSRLVHHAYLPRAGIGGGLFGDDGRLLGILVPTPDWTDRIHVAVHAGHVGELLESAGPPRPLATLKRAREITPVRDPNAVTRQRDQLHLPPLDCDTMRRGASLGERLQALRRRLAAIPEARRLLATRAQRWANEERLPQQRFEEVQRLIAANRLAIASIETEMEAIIPGSEAPLPGSEDALRARSDRAYSPRQRALGQQLETEHQFLTARLAACQADRLRLRSRAPQIDADTRALDRLEEVLPGEIFFAGDPLGMRGEEEIEDALPELDDEIAEGRPAGVFLLLRGLWLTRLERFDDARADFDRLLDEDRQLRSAAELARARAEGRRRGEPLADAVVRGARRGKGDPIMETLLARVAIDQKDWALAAGWLRAALEHGGDSGELHTGLAMVTLATGKGPGAPRLAADHAEKACRASLGTDRRAWGLVGLSAAAAGKWDEAGETLDHAAPLATDFAPETLRHWRRCVRDRKLPDSWFAP